MPSAAEPDLSSATWHTSSYSDGHGGACLEVADGLPGVVPVRDSKVPDAAPLVFGASAWAAFVGSPVSWA